MGIPRIRRFGTDVPASEIGSPERIMKGTPVTTVHNYYESTDHKFFAGVWESTVGKWRVSYTEDEFCNLLTGKVILTADDGTMQTFIAGDSFVIPAGFSGIWETIEPVRKLYAIYQA
jgi:uncharacterized cupin superfamily protein